MTHITVVFHGGVRGKDRAGYGGYALTQGSSRRITRVEFGGPMDPREAAYDTLITALEALTRQVPVPETWVEVQCPDSQIANHILGKPSTASLSQHRARVLELLRPYKGYTITHIPPDQAERAVAR